MKPEFLYHIIEKTYESMRAGEKGFAISTGFYDLENNIVIGVSEQKNVSAESVEIGFDNLMNSYRDAIVLEAMCKLYKESYGYNDKINTLFLSQSVRIKGLGECAIDLWRKKDERVKKRNKNAKKSFIIRIKEIMS